MSYFVTEAVILTEGIPFMPKSVLIVLAQAAGHDGSEARPSLDTIARLAGMGNGKPGSGKSTAAKWIAWLEAEGWIVPEKHDGGGRDRNGYGRAVEYRVVTEKLHYVKGLLYRDANILQCRTLPDENIPQDRTLEDKDSGKVLRGESKVPQCESNLLQCESNVPQHRTQSVLESGFESVSESVHSSSDKPKNVISFSSQKEKITSSEPEADPLDRPLTFPRDTARGQAWEDWQAAIYALKDEGATRTDITDILYFANMRHERGHTVTGRYLVNYWRDLKAKPTFGQPARADGKGA